MWLLLKVVLFNLIVPSLFLGWLPWHLLRRPPLPTEWTVQHIAALPLLLLGLTVYLHAFWYLATVGRGTPLPLDAPRKLVQRGPYRWTRNPLYLAAVLILLGEAVFFLNPWLLGYAVFVASALQLLVVLHEEEAMRRRFGAIYSDYCHLVPRWWPRRPRPRPQTTHPFSPSR